MNAKVTVVIPNYNGIKFLPDCLDSITNQVEGTPKTEILIIDNGSMDESVSYIKDKYPGAVDVLGEKISENCSVRLIVLPTNTGFTGAVNTGIMSSESEYVLLLNNDTKVFNDFVLRLYERIESDKRLFSVSAKMLMWDDNTLIDDCGDNYTVLGYAYSRGKGKKANLYNKPCNVFSACGGAAIYRRECFIKIGIFDDVHFAYLEDLDIGYRARINGYINAFEPTAQVIHFGSASTGSRYNIYKTKLAAANNIYVIYKNMPLLQLLFNLPFLLVGFFVKYLFFVKKRMGKLYLQGLGQGIRKSFSHEGRANKVRYHISNSWNYFKIQMSLFSNVFGLLKG